MNYRVALHLLIWVARLATPNCLTNKNHPAAHPIATEGGVIIPSGGNPKNAARNITNATDF
jgi:hypothetical protein